MESNTNMNVTQAKKKTEEETAKKTT